jgi:hypothetical protein
MYEYVYGYMCTVFIAGRKDMKLSVLRKLSILRKLSVLREAVTSEELS